MNTEEHLQRKGQSPLPHLELKTIGIISLQGSVTLAPSGTVGNQRVLANRTVCQLLNRFFSNQRTWKGLTPIILISCKVHSAALCRARHLGRSPSTYMSMSSMFFS